MLTFTSDRQRRERAVFAVVMAELARQAMSDASGHRATGGIDPKARDALLRAFAFVAEQECDGRAKLLAGLERTSRRVLDPHRGRPILQVIIGATHALQVVLAYDVLRLHAGSPFALAYDAWLEALLRRPENMAAVVEHDEAGRAVGQAILADLQRDNLFRRLNPTAPPDLAA